MSTTTSTTPTSSSAPSTRGRRQGGPPLLVPVLAFAVLTVASFALGASAPRPDTSLTKRLCGPCRPPCTGRGQNKKAR